jgi:diguanylate cyclase (GGDEF)-like protein
VDQRAEDFSLRTIRRLFEPRDDPYAGVFLDEPRRIGGVLCLVLVALAAPLAAAAPPTEAIDDGGWFVLGGIEALNLIAAYLLLRPGSAVGFNGMLALTYFAIAQIAVVEWLAGGHQTPYHQLYLAPAVLPPSLHPPRRAFSILIATTGALFLPLAYDGWNGEQAADMALQAAFIWMLALITMVVMNAVREQRLGLLVEGEEANRLARSDALTGLGNRLAFNEALEREIARSRRTGAPVSILVLDLDGFKGINDRFGHPVGDQTLKAVATGMLSAVRVPDTCFRWGGDEFAVLLPETGREAGAEVGERLRGAIRSPLPGGAPVGLTYGIAELADGQGAAELVAAADSRLLEAKRRSGQPAQG